MKGRKFVKLIENEGFVILNRRTRRKKKMIEYNRSVVFN